MTYTITCEECEHERDNESIYIGETSRTAYIRGTEHMEALRRKRESSVLWKHCRRHHDDEPCNFRMDVVGVHGNDAMLRQVGEGVMIHRTPSQQLMNDRSEWNFVNLPRVAIERDFP